MENRSPNSQPKKKPKSEKYLFFKNSKSIPYSASKRSNRNNIQRSVKSHKKYHEEENNVNLIRNEENNNVMNKISTSEIITPITGLNPEIQFVLQEYEMNNSKHNSTDSEVEKFSITTPSYGESGSINDVMQTENDKNVMSCKSLNLLRNQDFEIKCEESIIFPDENVPEFCNSQTEDCHNLDDFQVISAESNNLNPFWGDFQNSNLFEEYHFNSALNSTEEEQSMMHEDVQIKDITNFNSDLNGFDTCQSTNLSTYNLRSDKLSEVSSKLIEPKFKSNRGEEINEMGKQNQIHEAGATPTSHEILQTLSDNNPPSSDSCKKLDYSGTHELRPESLYAGTSSEVEKSFWGDFQNSNLFEEYHFNAALNSAEEEQSMMHEDVQIKDITNFNSDSDLYGFDTCQSTNLSTYNLRCDKLSEVSSKLIEPKFKSNRSEEINEMGEQNQIHEAGDTPTSHEISQTLSDNNSPSSDSCKKLDYSGTHELLPESLYAGTSSEVEKSEEDDNEMSLPRIMLSKEDRRASSERNISGSNRFSSCDESAAFANFVACQLRHLPLDSALLCQNAIVQMVIDERRRLLGSQEAAAISDQEK